MEDAATAQNSTQNLDEFSPTPSSSTAPSISSLPPEALTLATRIYNACRTGDLPLLAQALPAGLPPNMTNEKGDTLIMLAAYHGHASLVRLLLEHGADPNRLNDRGQSPLAGAVFKNEEEVVAALVEGGADPDAGEPSALEATRLFGMEGRWGGSFENAKGRGTVKKEEGGGGVGGQMGAQQPL